MIKNIEISNFRNLHDISIPIAPQVTAICGLNATGKSTLLALLGHSAELKRKDGKTIFNTAFRTEFSEIIKGDKDFDPTGTFATVNYTSANTPDTIVDYRKLRVTWPNEKKKIKLPSGDDKIVTSERFRIVSGKSIISKGKAIRKDSKYTWPTFYLGLSRLYPYGETNDSTNKIKKLSFNDEEEKLWYTNTYNNILNTSDIIIDVQYISHKEAAKTVASSTETYPFVSNSAGQDNIGQILFSMISFKRLKTSFESQGKTWDGGLLLIDELDATLHPVAQVKLYKELVDFSKEYNVQVVFTTHSIYLLKIIHKLISSDRRYKDCEIINMTRRNKIVQVDVDPEFDVIYNDLTLNDPFITANSKIPVFTEDKETRWLIQKLLPDYLDRIYFLDATFPCTELLRLRKADPNYFTKAIIVVDGDVDILQIDSANSVNPDSGRNVKNLLSLPCKVPPEVMLYDYLTKEMSAEHPFWAANPQISIMMIEENGPLKSDKYSNLRKEREKNKAWFNDHIDLFENTRIIDYWVQDHQLEWKAFDTDFQKALSAVKREINSNII